MTAPRSRRLVTLAAAVAVLVGGVLLAWSAGGPAQAGGPVQRGSLEATNTAVPAGGRVALFGKIGKKADRAVKVQELRGDHWVVVAKSRTRSDGRFAVDVATPSRPGTVTYRVLVPKYALVRSRTETGRRRYAPTVTSSVSITLTTPSPSPTPTPKPSPSPTPTPTPTPTLLPGLPTLPIPLPLVQH